MSSVAAECPKCKEDRGRKVCATVIGLLGFAFILNALVFWDGNRLTERNAEAIEAQNTLVAKGLEVPPSEVKTLVEEVKALLEKHEELMDSGVTRELKNIHSEYPVYLREILALLRRLNNEPPNNGEPNVQEYGPPHR